MFLVTSLSGDKLLGFSGVFISQHVDCLYVMCTIFISSWSRTELPELVTKRLDYLGCCRITWLFLASFQLSLYAGAELLRRVLQQQNKQLPEAINIYPELSGKREERSGQLFFLLLLKVFRQSYRVVRGQSYLLLLHWLVVSSALVTRTASYCPHPSRIYLSQPACLLPGTRYCCCRAVSKKRRELDGVLG